MVNVISNGQNFNITQSLYESILKNNPELLNEKEDKDKEYETNLFVLGDVFNKVMGHDWDKNEQEEAIEMMKRNGINYDDPGKFEKLLRKQKEEDDRRNAERNAENKKTIDRLIKQNPNMKKVPDKKTEEEIEKEKRENEAIERKNFFNNKILNKKDKNKEMSDEEEKEYVNKHMNQIYKVVDSYLFNSDVPDNIVVFYADVENEFNSKNVPGTGKLLAQFKQFGKVSPIPYIASTPKSMYVDFVKNNNVKTKTGVDIWRILKEIPIKEFWKNVAVVYCTTEGSYSLVTSLINNIQNNRDEIECFGKQIPTGFNTRTMVFTVVDRKSYENNDLTDIRQRQTFDDMKKIGKKRENDIDNEKKSRIYTKTGEAYSTGEMYQGEGETLRLLNELKRQYFIIVTEGMFKKGKLLKNIGNKFKKFMPSLDTNYKNLFNDN